MMRKKQEESFLVDLGDCQERVGSNGRDGVGVISGTSEISHDGSPLYFAPMIIIFHPRRDSGTPGQVTLLTDSVLFV